MLGARNNTAVKVVDAPSPGRHQIQNRTSLSDDHKYNRKNTEHKILNNGDAIAYIVPNKNQCEGDKPLAGNEAKLSGTASTRALHTFLRNTSDKRSHHLTLQQFRQVPER